MKHIVWTLVFDVHRYHLNNLKKIVQVFSVVLYLCKSLVFKFIMQSGKKSIIFILLKLEFFNG